MELKLSSESIKIIQYARDEAMRTGSYGIGADHLMLGILRHSNNGAAECLRKAGIDSTALKKHLDNALFSEKAVPYSDMDKVQPTKALQKVLGISVLEALRVESGSIEPVHFLLAVCRAEESVCTRYLSGKGIGYKEMSAISGTVGTNRSEERKMRPEDIAGVLGEQLSNIFGSYKGAYKQKKNLLN